MLKMITNQLGVMGPYRKQHVFTCKHDGPTVWPKYSPIIALRANKPFGGYLLATTLIFTAEAGITAATGALLALQNIFGVNFCRNDVKSAVEQS